MQTVPNYALYGTDAQPAWVDSFYFEQISTRASAYHWEIQPHVHTVLIHILYVRRGSGVVFIEDAKWAFEPLCLIVIPAGLVHGFHFATDVDGPVVTAAQRPLESLATVVAPELLTHIRSPAVIPVVPSVRYAEALMPLFEAVERESNIHAPGQVAAGMSLLLALFVQIARIGAGMESAGRVSRSRKAAQIERFRALVDTSFREHLPVEHYAAELGVTSGQLNRLCREVLGMTTLEAIHARVLHEAQRDLVYSALSVKQIAGLLGFADEAYFGRFFKKQTGRTASEFRERARRQLEPGSSNPVPA